MNLTFDQRTALLEAVGTLYPPIPTERDVAAFAAGIAYQQAKWISVEDDLPPTEAVFSGGPKTSRYVIVATEGGGVSVGWLSQTDKQRLWKWRTHYTSDAQVTHWMPMPLHPVRREE